MQHATANAVNRPFNTFPYNRKCLETSNRILKSRVSAKRIQAVCHKHGSVLFRNARAPAVFHAKHRRQKNGPPPSPRQRCYIMLFSACGSTQGKWKARPQCPASPQTSTLPHDSAFSPSAGRFWRVRVSLFSESTSL